MAEELIDDESRRPKIELDDPVGTGGNRIIYESDVNLGRIEKQIYILCKEIPSGEAFNDAFKILRTIVKNLIKDNPEKLESAHLQLRINNEKLMEKLLKYPGALELLQLIGFTEKDEQQDNIIRISPSKIDTIFMQQIYNSLCRAQPVVKVLPIPHVERDLKIFYLSDLLKHRSQENKLAKDDKGQGDVPMTGDGREISEKALERRALRQGLEDMQRRNKMINPTHLMSHEKRKELLGIKDREYDITIIHIELPKNPNNSSHTSAFVIEGKFHPREGIDKLYEFVNECLDEEVISRGVEYALYLPPKQEITIYPKNVKKNTLSAKVNTFKDYQMFPASMVRLLFTNNTEPLNTYKGAFLKEQLCQQVTTQFSVLNEVGEGDIKNTSEEKNDQEQSGQHKEQEQKTEEESQDAKKKSRGKGATDKFIKGLLRGNK